MGTDPDLPAIYVVGKLVIDDTVGGGRITHKGPAQVNTAAISNSGELELAGGSICDCTGSRPAIGNANLFRMTGGMISNCVSDTTSAFENYGEFVLEGGTIIDCRALATGRDLRFTLRRSESTSRYFTVRQSLSGK